MRAGYDCGLFVDCYNRCGNLGLLWRSDLNVSLRSYSKNHIDVDIEDS